MTANSLPDLMFVCALEPKALRALFEDRFVLDDLKSLEAGAALVVRDFSDERAQAVRLLNKLGIPVSAWLLLPGEQGSWLDPTHTAQAGELYQALTHWSAQKGLRWSALGFGALPAEERALGKRNSAQMSDSKVSTLLDQAHADGFAVELVYTLPEAHASQKALLHARRRTTECLPGAERCIRLQPFEGVSLGEGSAQEDGAVCVSSTHGNLSLGNPSADEPKTWQEFAREIRTARQNSSAVYVFTLEACAKQGFLDRLVTLDWSGQTPGVQASTSNRVRGSLMGLEKKHWLGMAALAGFLGSALLIAKKNRKT